MTSHVYAGLLAVLMTFIVTPPVRRLAIRMRLLDYPGQRRVHRTPRPLGGGLALYISFWLALVLSGHWTSHLWGLLISSTIILVTGLVDDRRALRPGIKLAWQVVASLILVASGTRIEFVTNPLGGMVHLAFWSVPVTLLWLVTITNIVNLIDGLDGLAAGVVAIACAPMVGVALMMDQPFAALLAVVLAGSILGFLPYNFNPARIFMGDAGALFLGFVLGAISIEGALKGPTVIAIGVSVLALGLPILDTAFAILRRLRAGRPFYQADQGHVHHRLLARGYTQRQAVMLLYAVSALMSTVAILLLDLTAGQAFALISIVVLTVIGIGSHFGLQVWRDE